MWDKNGSSGGSYTPSNKSTLDKLSDNGSSLLFNGVSMGSGGGDSAPSKWSGKVWSMLGDSITAVNAGYATTSYWSIVQSKTGISTLNNYAVNGSGWRNNGMGGTNAFHTKVSGVASNSDLISVFGGTNDWNEVSHTMVLGSFGDTVPATSFFGAVDSTLSQLIAKFPTKTIAVFTPLPRDNAWAAKSGVTLEQVTDAIIKVCNHYSIPVLDLYRNSSMFPYNAAFRTAIMPDGLHPNNTGHAAMADKILSFLNTL